MFKIAIDGPSGAGKSTLAKNLAKELGFIYVDTGAMYRTIGLAAHRSGIMPDDVAGIEKMLETITLRIVYENGSQRELLNGEDVTDHIRTPEISTYASKVSAIPAVRAFLLGPQRDFADNYNVIMDGRDIGTVIMPNADVKIFLVSGKEARAKRRYEELVLKGENVTYESVLCDLIARDDRDSSRKTAPAIPAEDAVFVDNSDLLPEQTLELVLGIINKAINKED